MSDDKSARIRELNDQFRRTFVGGLVEYTSGVNALPNDVVFRLTEAVKNFDNFTDGNDPHNEHDFGQVEIDGQTFFFKIDYYGIGLKNGSDDPSDPAVTTRVMTIMLSEEY